MPYIQDLRLLGIHFGCDDSTGKPYEDGLSIDPKRSLSMHNDSYRLPKQICRGALQVPDILLLQDFQFFWLHICRYLPYGYRSEH